MATWNPCSYPGHRQSDWMSHDGSGPVTCGICHPPASDDVAHRSAPGWNKALRQRERVIETQRRRATDPFNTLGDEVA